MFTCSFNLRFKIDFKHLVDKDTINKYLCQDNALVRVEGNVVKFCSGFTHLKCHSVGWFTSGQSSWSNKPSTDASSTTFNVIHVVSNMSSSELNHYLELYQIRTC